MGFRAFGERMITDDSIMLYGPGREILGYEFNLRYPSYRGAWLSNIEKLEIEVDGEPVSPADMRFSVNGKWFLMSELKEMFKEYWFTTTKASIRVLKDGGLSRARKHQISVQMDHKIPYTGYFGNYLVIHIDCTKKLHVERS